MVTKTTKKKQPTMEMKKGRAMKSMKKAKKSSMKVAKKSMKVVKKSMKDAKKSMKKIGGMKKKTMKKGGAKKVAEKSMKKSTKPKKSSKKVGVMKRAMKVKKAVKSAMKSASMMKKSCAAAAMKSSPASRTMKSSPIASLMKKSVDSPRTKAKTLDAKKGRPVPKRKSLPTFLEPDAAEGAKKKRRSSIGLDSEKTRARTCPTEEPTIPEKKKEEKEAVLDHSHTNSTLDGTPPDQDCLVNDMQSDGYESSDEYAGNHGFLDPSSSEYTEESSERGREHSPDVSEEDEAAYYDRQEEAQHHVASYGKIYHHYQQIASRARDSQQIDRRPHEEYPRSLIRPDNNDFLTNSREDSESYPYPSLSNPQASPDRYRSPPPTRRPVYDVSQRFGYSRHPDEDPFQTPIQRSRIMGPFYTPMPPPTPTSPLMMGINTLNSPGRTPFNMPNSGSRSSSTPPHAVVHGGLRRGYTSLSSMTRPEEPADSFHGSSLSSLSPESMADSLSGSPWSRNQVSSPQSPNHAADSPWSRNQYSSPQSQSESQSNSRVVSSYQSPDGRVRPRGYEPREHRRVGSAELLGRRWEIIPPPPSARRHSLDMRDLRDHASRGDGRMRMQEHSGGSEGTDELSPGVTSAAAAQAGSEFSSPTPRPRELPRHLLNAPVAQVRNRFNMPVEPEEYLLDIFQVLDVELQRDIYAGNLSRFDSIKERVDENCEYFLNIDRLERIIGHARRHIDAKFVDECLTIIQLKDGLEWRGELSQAEMWQRVREVKELLRKKPPKRNSIERPPGTRPRGLQFDVDSPASSTRRMR